MRDLAKQNLSIRRSKGIVSPSAYRALVLVVAIIGLLFLIKAKIGSGGLIGGGTFGLKEAPHGLTPVKVDGPSDSSGVVRLSSDAASFEDVKYGGQAKATASRKFGAGSLSVSVSATLPDPKGDRYQVWILNNGGQIKDAGFMQGSGSSWSLVYNDSDKYSSYNTIWITREITTEDGKPEQHVLEGSF